jgi:hypothetical protein
VVSSGNLETASPQLSGHDDVLLEQIAGPSTGTRADREGGRVIVNTFVLALTPLRAGTIDVGPFVIGGTLAGGLPFEARAAQPTRLRVRPAMAAVRPWLPLQGLTVSMALDDEANLAEGRPVTLTLTLEGRGALGEQLPSLEAKLQSSEDFRVYREQTLIDTELVDNGRQLLGTRTEYYTLVPQSGGRLHLPEVRIGWWNVDSATRETSGVAIRTLTASGDAGTFGFTRATERNAVGAWRWVWMPLAGVALLLVGYWGGVWLRGLRRGAPDPSPVAAPTASAGRDRSAPPKPERRRRLAQAMAGLGHRLAGHLSRLSLKPLGHLIRRQWQRLTPRSVRVYRCAVAAHDAPTPAAWALAFQNRVCWELPGHGSGTREPLPRIADRIVALRPGADGAKVRALLQRLDTALYNNEPIAFPHWKREFRRALRPGLGGLRSLFANRVHRARLPELNPRPADP